MVKQDRCDECESSVHIDEDFFDKRALHSGSRNLLTHRKVRVGSKTGDLSGKNLEDRVLAGR